ncbi:MAG: YkvA family protein [Saprospiraceae bacterium]
MKETIKKYQNKFSELKLWVLLKNSAQRLGTKTVYSALLLYYSYKRKETPAWAKRTIIGVLGYLIAPIDMIPDLSPLLGFTDDLGFLSFGLVTIASFINVEVKENAKTHLGKWIKDYDEADVAAVDAKF